jgi:hypothetical protein
VSMDSGQLLPLVLDAMVLGVIATLATDLWAQVLKRVARVPTNWGMVGRWVGWFPRGVFAHRPISTSGAIPGELAIGWAFHYAVGIAYAALYLAIVRLGFNSAPTFASALLFGLATIVAPWFIMQPALGLGFMAARAPKPAAARAIGLSMHTVFGLGLYLGVMIWQR